MVDWEALKIDRASTAPHATPHQGAEQAERRPARPECVGQGWMGLALGWAWKLDGWVDGHGRAHNRAALELVRLALFDRWGGGPAQMEIEDGHGYGYGNDMPEGSQSWLGRNTLVALADHSQQAALEQGQTWGPTPVALSENTWAGDWDWN